MKHFILLYFFIFSSIGYTQISTYVRPCMSISTVEKSNNFFHSINNSLATLNFSNSLKRVNLIPLKRPISSGETFSEYGRDITSYLFNRDSNNLFNVQKILELSEYASSDVQSFISNNSADKDQILTQIANEMLDKVYILTIDLKSIESYEDYYNRKEAKRIAQNERTKKLGGEVSEANKKPVKRKLYGYLCDFGFKLRKLKWTPEKLNYFYQNCWVDENSSNLEIQKKVENFSLFNLDSEIVLEESELNVAVGRSKSKGANGSFKTPTKEQMNEVLTSSLPLSIVKQSNKLIVENVSEFKIFNVLSSTDPCKSKVGTKEGIKINDRYFAYEKIQKRNGETLLRRKGVLYVNEVVNNEEDNSLASNFLQRGGRSLYNGMMIYEELDKKINFDINYNHNNITPLNLSKYSLSIGFGPFGKRSAAYMSLSLGGSSFKELKYNLDSIPDVDSIPPYPILADGYSISIGLEFARAIYLTKRGNIFLYPNFSVNAGFLSFTKKDNEDFEDDEYQPSPVILETRFGLGIGFHIIPSVSILYKPSLGYNIAAWESDDNNDDDEYDFRRISKMGDGITRKGFRNNFINTISLRIHI